MGRPLILDTDIGTDVDDAFALVMAVATPEIDLRAVTTVYGDVDLRARMARKFLNQLGRNDVPVASGEGTPLFDGKNSYWGGWEGRGFLSPLDELIYYESSDAVELIYQILASSLEKVTLVGIGPLTNLGNLLRDHKDIYPKIERVICMAGSLQPEDEEWNFQCDPEAAMVVLTCGLPLTLGTRHFVRKPCLTQSDRTKLAASPNPVVQALIKLFDEFLSHKTRDYSPMYDPITLSMAFTDQFIPTQTKYFKIRDSNHVIQLIPATSHQNAVVPIAVPVEVYPRRFMNYLVNLLTNLN